MIDNNMVAAGTILKAQLAQMEIEYSEKAQEILAPIDKCAGEISAIIRKGIEDYYKQAGENPDALIFGMWNIFAGVGSIGLLTEEPVTFDAKAVEEGLIKPEGITNLDEHVIRKEGLNPEEMNRTALEAAKTGAQAYAKSFMKLPHEKKPDQIREYEKACLIFGAAYQLKRKGHI